MATIIFFPLPEFGHISPTLALAQHLTTSGHHVTYLTAPQFTAIIEASGASVARLIDQDVDEMMSGSSIWFRFAKEHGGTRSYRLCKILEEVMQHLNPDLVLCDRILAYNYRSELVNVMGWRRTVLFSTSLFNWTHKGEDGPKCPTLVFCPDSFELPKFRQRYDKIFHVECSFRPKGSPFVVDEIIPESPRLVVAAFGTQSARYTDLQHRLAIVLEVAARHPELQFAIASGTSKRVEEWCLGFDLPNVFIRKTLPQRELLSRAEALITHGGLGSIKEAVSEGVPLIVLPILHDQPYNAMRVRHHGLGDAVFQENLCADSVERVLMKARRGSYSQNITMMRATFLAMERSRFSHLLIDNRLAACGNVAK
jgi:UDP:flavonoid glycosyltransferase YjiC (YdhE family)